MYTSPKSNEKKIVVVRTQVPSQYSNALAGYDRIIATGACGSGKSSFAIAYIWKVSRMRLHVVQPDDMSRINFERGIGKACKQLGSQPLYKCQTAQEFVRSASGANSAVNNADVVVVDDIHTQSVDVAVAVQITREKARKYILISATLGGDHNGALGTVAIKQLFSPHVRYDRVVVRGMSDTLYDPKMWPGTINKVLVYPVTSNMRNTMMRFYKQRGYSTIVLPTTRRLDNYNVVIAMPGTDMGIDVNADMLIDSGYTDSTSDINGVVVRKPMPISLVDQKQRWARLGRTNTAGIIVHPGVSNISDNQNFSNYDKTMIAIGFAKHGLSKSDARSLYGIRMEQYSTQVARSVSSHKNVYGEYIATLYENTVPKLFIGDKFAIPGNVLRTDVDLSHSKIANLSFGANIGFRRALKIFLSNKRKYRLALLAYFFGANGNVKVSANLSSYINKYAADGMELNNDDISLIKMLTFYEIDNKSKKFRTRLCWPGSNGTHTSADFDGDVPYARFARAVSYLQNCDTVDASKFSSINLNRSLARFFFDKLRTEGIEPHPGPINGKAIKRWFDNTNMTISFVKSGVGCRQPMFTSWKTLEKNYGKYLMVNGKSLQGSVLVVHAHLGVPTGDILTIDDIDHDISIAGFDVYPTVTLPVDKATVAIFSPLGSKSSHMAYWLCKMPNVPNVVPDVQRVPGLVRLPRKDIAEKIYDWHCQTGHSIVIRHLDGQKAPTNFIDLRQINKAYMRSKRGLNANLVNSALVIYVDDSSSDVGDLKLDDMHYDIAGYGIHSMDTIDIDDEMSMDCHFSNGTFAQLMVISVYDPESISGLADKRVEPNVSNVTVVSPVRSLSKSGYYVTGGADGNDDDDIIPPNLFDDDQPLQRTKTITNIGKPNIRQSPVDGAILFNPPTTPYLAGGDDNGSDAQKLRATANKIDLTAPDIMNAKPQVQSGRYLTDDEMGLLHKAVGKYGSGYYLALLHHLINTDASNNVEDTDKFVSGGETYSFSRIFAVLAKELDENRFTVRRYARSMAASFLPLWEESEYFQNLRESSLNPLKGRAGLNDMDAIYATSFFEHLRPERVKAAVNMYNSTRTVTGDAKVRSTAKTFNSNIVHEGSGSSKVNHTRVPK